LGKSFNTFWRRFNGSLDDVQFYYRNLSAAEVAQSMTLGPSISTSRSGNQLTLSWPATGFVLQEISNLNNSAGWGNVAGGATSPVTVTMTNAARYYRLLKQ
jgi:hypothetical protein